MDIIIKPKFELWQYIDGTNDRFVSNIHRIFVVYHYYVKTVYHLIRLLVLLINVLPLEE